MLKPVCVPCQRFFRIEKSGFIFIEGMPMPGADRALPGTLEPERWQPYKLWAGDLWRCESCGAKILSGFGNGPISEHYRSDFANLAEMSQLQVNDC